MESRIIVLDEGAYQKLKDVLESTLDLEHPDSQLAIDAGMLLEAIVGQEA